MASQLQILLMVALKLVYCTRSRKRQGSDLVGTPLPLEEGPPGGCQFDGARIYK